MDDQQLFSNFRQKGLTSSQGKLYKGFVHDATKKTSISSIPNKIENIIYDTKSKAAFGASTNRFNENGSIAPGPGHYIKDDSINTTILKTKENSQSMASIILNQSSITEQQYYANTKKEPIYDKGFGRVERDTFGQRYVSQGPSVGQYNPENDFKGSQIRAHNKKGDPMFIESALQKNPSIKVIQKLENPGPGDYEVLNKKREINYHSAFHTTSQRNPDLIRNDYPSVGRYNLKRNLTDNNVFQKMGYQSMFQIPSGQKRISADLQLKIIKKFLNDDESTKKLKKGQGVIPILEEPEQLPSVGQYDPKEVQYFKKSQPDFVFIDGLKDRFGDFYDKNLEKQPLPGPTKYDTNKYGIDEIAKEHALVTGAAFISESKRQPYGDFDKKLGPNTNIANVNKQKKSFLLNIERKWV